MNLELPTIASITMICLLVGMGVKSSKLDSKWIPCIVGGLGGLLGVAAMYVMPDFPAADPLTAAAIGIASGLAATGAHQAVKQIKGGIRNETTAAHK